MECALFLVSSEDVPPPQRPLFVDRCVDLEFPLSLDEPPETPRFARRTLTQRFGFPQLRHSAPYAGQLSLVLEKGSRP